MKLTDEQIKQIKMNTPVNDTANFGEAIAFARAIEAAVLAQGEPDQRFINLLCRIHRDGGHYIAEHGLDRAASDADVLVAELFAMCGDPPAPEAKQEPVAWMYQNANTDSEYLVWKRSPGGRNWKPLYTHPAPEAKQEPLLTLGLRKGKGWLYDENYRHLPDGVYKLFPHPAPVNTALLEACRTALYCLEDVFGKNKVDVGAINALRAAIAAAEGKV